MNAPDPEAAWLARYEDLSLGEARSLAETERRTVRVLRPGDMVTLEWSPGRLNLHLDEAGDLVRMTAG